MISPAGRSEPANPAPVGRGVFRAPVTAVASESQHQRQRSGDPVVGGQGNDAEPGGGFVELEWESRALSVKAPGGGPSIDRLGSVARRLMVGRGVKARSAGAAPASPLRWSGWSAPAPRVRAGSLEQSADQEGGSPYHEKPSAAAGIASSRSGDIRSGSAKMASKAST